MPEPTDLFAAPVARALPLSGVTILLVEDSRYCSEAVRLMALRTGARLRRADSIAAAHKHLRMYAPDVIIVDLGLPDGSGLDLVHALSHPEGEGPAVIATSGDPAAEMAAMAAGAQGFLPKPIPSLAQFQSNVQSLLDGGPGLAAVSADTGPPDIDNQALTDDLARISEILEQALPEKDGDQMRYCAQFLNSLAQTAQDEELASQAEAFFSRMDRGSTGERTGRQVLDALRDRLSQHASGIRSSVA